MRRGILQEKQQEKDCKHRQLQNVRKYIKPLIDDLLISPQSTDVGPPLGNAKDKLAASAVHELRIAKASPSIARGEKLRFNSPLWPRAASWAASASLSGW